VVEPARLAAPLGRFLSGLHEAPVEMFAPLVPRDTVPLTAWRDEAEVSYRTVVDHIPVEARRTVEDLLGRTPPAEPRTASFCHNDLGSEHVLVDAEATAAVTSSSTPGAPSSRTSPTA
jgi:aminoglycoside phosphotransferase (APT) family kinase protein